MTKLSLSIKLLLLFIASTIVIVAVVVFAVHSRFESQMVDEYSRMAHGVTALMAQKVDGDKVDEYMRDNFSSKEYREVRDYFYKLRRHYPDVLYIYSYRCEADGGHIIFDLSTDEVENSEPTKPCIKIKKNTRSEPAT